MGPLEWGGALWADLDGDGRDEAIAGTRDARIVALKPDGAILWTYSNPEIATSLPCPIAAADANGDGKSEVFAVDILGPFCLDHAGSLLWHTHTGHQFLSGPSVADADRNGKPELYCLGWDDNALLAFDALSGQPVWRAPLMAKGDVYPGSSIAVGDMDHDGHQEIVAADASGYVYCVASTGALQWVFATEKRVHASATLGDVDGDGGIEVLVACGDHYLYCLNARGELEWRFEAQFRLIHPPTIADIDDDGKTDILFGGSDRILRCLTFDAPYNPQRVPWPSRRFDVAQTCLLYTSDAADE